jgi:hypothetical protein
MNSISVLTSHYVVSYIDQGLKQTHAHRPFVGNGNGRGHEFGFPYSMYSHETVSPKPLSILLGPFQIFSKILRYICSSRYTTHVIDTGGKWKKSSIRKVKSFNYFVWTPLGSR